MSRPRQGWKEKFKMMAESGDDQMIDAELGEQTERDKKEWECIP